MCHVSRVRCHVSHVTYNFFIFKKIGLGGGASWWRVCYQWGLPRLVFEILDIKVHNNLSIGSKETVNFLTWWILPIGGVASENYFLQNCLCLWPAQCWYGSEPRQRKYIGCRVFIGSGRRCTNTKQLVIVIQHCIMLLRTALHCVLAESRHDLVTVGLQGKITPVQLLAKTRQTKLKQA